MDNDKENAELLFSQLKGDEDVSEKTILHLTDKKSSKTEVSSLSGVISGKLIKARQSANPAMAMLNGKL